MITSPVIEVPRLACDGSSIIEPSISPRTFYKIDCRKLFQMDDRNGELGTIENEIDGSIKERMIFKAKSRDPNVTITISARKKKIEQKISANKSKNLIGRSNNRDCVEIQTLKSRVSRKKKKSQKLAQLPKLKPITMGSLPLGTQFESQFFMTKSKQIFQCDVFYGQFR